MTRLRLTLEILCEMMLTTAVSVVVVAVVVVVAAVAAATIYNVSYNYKLILPGF